MLPWVAYISLLELGLGLGFRGLGLVYCVVTLIEVYMYSGLGLEFVALFLCVENTFKNIAGWKSLELTVQIQRVKTCVRIQ